MRIAVLADVHGNLHALAAVVADLRRHSPDAVVNLGDLVSGPFDPASAADAQMALGAATLMGNHDRWVLEGAPAGYADDHEAASLQAERAGDPDTAHAVRTGRMPAAPA